MKKMFPNLKALRFSLFLVCLLAGLSASATITFVGGTRQTMSVCEGMTTNISTSPDVMSVYESTAGATDTWTVVTAAVHGSLSGFSTSVTSGGGMTTPSGLTYYAGFGYSGTDSFTVQVSNGTFTTTSTVVVTINPLPAIGAITGVAHQCVGTTTTLSNSASGGTWAAISSSTASVDASTGDVTGMAVGTTTIFYMVTNSYGCTSIQSITDTVSAYSMPSAGTISGPSTVCVGVTGSFSSTGSGGVWSSQNTSLATINSAGSLTGVSPGFDTIFYRVTNACGSVFDMATVTVSAGATAGTIYGSTSLCVGSTDTLTSTGTGGTWASSSPSVATINSSGIITGVSAGTATITYSVTSSCGTTIATRTVTVISTPSAGTISGTTSVCAGSTTTLSSTVSGGYWTTSSSSVASVGGGVVVGVSAGSATISYTVTTSCGSATATTTVTVLPLPTVAAITGGAAICPTTTTTLSDATAGGVWSSASTSIATVGSGTGVVTGVAAGTAIISYTVTNSCGSTSVTYTATVNGLPSPGTITGGSPVCAGGTTTFADAVTGGTWSTASTSIATVTSGGVVTGVAGGTTSLFYAVTNSCGIATATATITVNALPVITITTGHGCNDHDTIIASGVSGGIYVWSGTGLSCSVCDTNIVTTYATTTYTVTAYDAAGCRDTNTITINANRIRGHITFSGTAPDTLDCKVWLVQFNPSDSSITALDSVNTCMDGGTPFYEFSGVAAGNYMVKAKLIYGTAPGTSGYVPTYSSSTTYWSSAAVAAHTSATDSLPINMVYGTVPTGAGFISGYVYSGAGKGTTGDVPVSGMIIYLRNAATNILTYVYTNSLGYYSFSNIADGTYNIYPAEFSYYTTPSASIVLAAGAETKNNVNFKQHTTSGTITPYDNLSVVKVAKEGGVQVYPNPASNSLNIEWTNMLTENVTVELMDVTGRTVYNNTWDVQKVQDNVKIDVSSLSSGVYLVHFRSGNISYIGKIVKE